MKPNLLDVYEMKMKLWNYRLVDMKTNKSEDWQLEDLLKVLKHLKNNKSRDPDSYINEIFKPKVIGTNLRDGLLQLANGIKTELSFPAFMQKVNITTIYKLGE